jgi:hypothetical protein
MEKRRRNNISKTQIHFFELVLSSIKTFPLNSMGIKKDYAFPH